jgi:hypothetical protein
MIDMTPNPDHDLDCPAWKGRDCVCPARPAPGALDSFGNPLPPARDASAEVEAWEQYHAARAHLGPNRQCCLICRAPLTDDELDYTAAHECAPAVQ